jgi:3-oxoacyl-[acyl-carrier protein] reductase
MSYEIDLEGKVAVITGASSGIGSETALTLARAGADLVLNGRRRKPLDDMADQIKTDFNKQALIVPGDVSNPDTAICIAKSTLQTFNRADILVNCAGITGNDNLLARISPESLQEILGVNLLGTMYVTQKVIPLMSKNKSGSIINISSVVEEIGVVGQTAYATSKGGIVAFTRNTAREYARRNIRVNALSFGAIATPMLDAAEEKVQGAKNKFIEMTPLGRLGTVQDAVGPILFLASDLSSYITGQVIDVNGGMVFRT